MDENLLSLLQKVEFTGVLGYVVAGAIFLGLIVATLKGAQWTWRTLGIPIRTKLRKKRTGYFEHEFIEFLSGWFDHQRDLAIFILDGDIRCIYANTGAERMFGVNFEDDLKGRRWQRLAKDPALILAKWETAKRNQGPFIHSTMGLGADGLEHQYWTKAEPFIFQGKVLYYFARVESQQATNIRSIDQAHEKSS